MKAITKPPLLIANSSTEKNNQAVVNVEFGSPIKNCLHYGICRVTVPATANEKPCTCQSKATIKNLGDNLVQFIFDQEEMSDHVFQKYFESGFFQVDDGYRLPERILKKINLQKHSIKKGNYPILKEDRFLKIVF